MLKPGGAGRKIKKEADPLGYRLKDAQ